MSRANRRTRALPNEALNIIMSQLRLRDLAKASRVCRDWQVIAFPHLYHTVYLTHARHLKLFAERSSSQCFAQLSIRGYTRRLVFDEAKYRDRFGRRTKGRRGVNRLIAEEDLQYLVAMLPKLRCLEHVSWDLDFIPRNPDVLRAMVEDCQNLRSVHWSINKFASHFQPLTDYDFSIFELVNLLHFSLSLRIPIEFEEENINESIVSLIRDCPDLQSLVLELHDDDDIFAPTWSPSAIMDALADRTFSSMHTFCALGSSNPNWREFFTSPDTNPLFDFFSRHPQLHTIGFGGAVYTGLVNPPGLAVLFPSLKHFQGPVFLCAPLIASSLANQLESLTVLDEYFLTEISGFKILAREVRSLPKLRKLILKFKRPSRIESKGLKALLRAAPMLEELEFGAPLDESYEILKVFKLAPNLRILGLPFEELEDEDVQYGDMEDEEFPKRRDPREHVITLAEACPLLECVKNTDPDEIHATCWHVWRDLGGNIVVD